MLNLILTVACRKTSFKIPITLTMSSLSASSATITAVAVFDNGRRVQGQGITLIIDAL